MRKNYEISEYGVIRSKEDYDMLKGDVVRIVQKGSYKSDEILNYVNKIIRNKK